MLSGRKSMTFCSNLKNSFNAEEEEKVSKVVVHTMNYFASVITFFSFIFASENCVYA